MSSFRIDLGSSATLKQLFSYPNAPGSPEALATTILLAFGTSLLAFSTPSLIAARTILLGVIVVTLLLGLVQPIRRLTCVNAVRKAEEAFPQLQQRLLQRLQRKSRLEFPNSTAAP